MSQKFIGMGNPLLDVSCQCTKPFIDGLGLDIKHNDAILVEDKHKDLMAKLKADPRCRLSPGGATQNSLRQAQILLKTSGSDLKCAYIGAVGSDESGSVMENFMKEAGLDVKQQKTDKPTGECSCLINDKDRSLITELGACTAYTIDHLKGLEADGVLADVRIAYSAGFFITSSPPAMEYMASRLSGSDAERMPGDETRIFATNFSAPFICAFFNDPLGKVLEMSDMVTCNDAEVLHWAKAMAYTEFHQVDKLIKDFPAPLSENFDDIKGEEKIALMQNLALKISSHTKKDERKRRVVVITCGTEPTICAVGDLVFQVPVEGLSDVSRVVDTNGAGDTFLGGLFAQLLVDDSLKAIFEDGNIEPMKKAITQGNKVAGLNVQVDGVGFPTGSVFSLTDKTLNASYEWTDDNHPNKLPKTVIDSF